MHSVNILIYFDVVIQITQLVTNELTQLDYFGIWINMMPDGVPFMFSQTIIYIFFLEKCLLGGIEERGHSKINSCSYVKLWGVCPKFHFTLVTSNSL